MTGRGRGGAACPTLRARERGLTLVELLISLTLLFVAVALLLSIYSGTSQSFKKGESAAEQQQSVRIALEKIGVDLRLAGFNYNPDGDPTRTDEQIEAAYDTAVAFRADFDADDPGLSTTPEAALAGGACETVSTGNDEIVVYVLAKPDGSSSDTLRFRADVKDSPRDGEPDFVRIRNVALVHDDPPYALYRITLSNNLADWGSDAFFVRDRLADNVGWLRFRYFDAVGGQVNDAPDLSTISDDIGGSEARAADRARIRQVDFDLAGLALDPEPGWIDPKDPDPATRRFRKFELTGNVRPRNLGITGIEDVKNVPSTL